MYASGEKRDDASHAGNAQGSGTYVRKEKILAHRVVPDKHGRLRLTPNQWSKRILGLVAKQHPDTIDQFLQDLPRDHQEAVRQDLEKVIYRLLNRRGYIL